MIVAKDHLTGALLNIIFFPVWFSIFNTEMAKLITIACYKGWKVQKKMRVAMSGILLHGILIHRQQEIQTRMHEVLQLPTDCTVEKYNDLQRKCRENTTLQSLLRSVENSMEHLPQLVIATNLLANISYSPKLRKFYLDLLGGDLNFIVLSAVISAFSLIVGQVSSFGLNNL